MPITYITTDRYLPKSYIASSNKINVSRLPPGDILPDTLRGNLSSSEYTVVNCISPDNINLTRYDPAISDMLKVLPYSGIDYDNVILKDGDIIIAIASKGYNWFIARYHEDGVVRPNKRLAFYDVVNTTTPIPSIWEFKSYLEDTLNAVKHIRRENMEADTCNEVLISILGANDPVAETSNWWWAEQKGKLDHEQEEGIKSALRLIHSFVTKLEADPTLHSSILALTKDYVE